MTTGSVSNFMSDYGCQSSLGLEDWEDSRVDRHLAPRHTPGVEFRALDQLDLPVKRLSGGFGNPHSNTFDHFYQAPVFGELRFCDNLPIRLIGFQVDALFIYGVRSQSSYYFSRTAK